MITDNKQETYEETNQALENSLYNNLKEEHHRTLDANATKYPNAHSSIVKVLKEKINPWGLRVDEAERLRTFVNIHPDDLPLERIYTLFNI